MLKHVPGVPDAGACLWKCLLWTGWQPPCWQRFEKKVVLSNAVWILLLHPNSHRCASFNDQHRAVLPS